MNTVNNSVLSQLDAKAAHGTAKPKADGDGKGQGKFAEAVASISAKAAGSAKSGREGVADPDLTGDAAPLPALGDQPATDGEVQAAPARAPQIPAELLEQAFVTGADAAVQSADGSKANETATPSHIAAQGFAAAANPSQFAATGAEKADGSDAGDGADGEAGGAEALDNLFSMLSGETQAPTQATVLPGASSIAAAVLGQASTAATQAKAGVAAEGDGMVVEPGAGQSRNTQALLATALAQGAVDGEAGATDAPAGDADQIFRLVRADGKAKPIEIAIGGNGEISGSGDGKLSIGAEAITVLDARRYLGLAQQGNSAAVTAAMTQDPSWAAALSDAAPDVTGKVVNTLKIQLQPIDLGTVTATLRLQGDALVVDLKVESGKAYRSLSEDQEAIVKALRGHGFAIDQISVQMSSSSDRSGNTGQGTGQGAGQGDAQSQFAGQQQAREGGGRQPGAETRNGTTAFNEGSAHDYAQTDGLASTNQPRGTGGVFL